jgi:signal transduction histidine kinase
LMHNLISNALKFSHQDRHPVITINSQIKKGNQFTGSDHPLVDTWLVPEKTYCHICFTDNGIGFEPHFSERIFGVFQKLHQKEEYTGTGIGLAMVKKIIENHSGKIIAEGKPDHGAIFHMYIPDPNV